jgi:hypothetical protein
MFKGLTARRLYKSFGVKGLRIVLLFPTNYGFPYKSSHCINWSFCARYHCLVLYQLQNLSYKSLLHSCIRTVTLVL